MNKKLIKTIASITCGLGIATAIPFMATSCGSTTTFESPYGKTYTFVDSGGEFNSNNYYAWIYQDGETVKEVKDLGAWIDQNDGKISSFDGYSDKTTKEQMKEHILTSLNYFSGGTIDVSNPRKVEEKNVADIHVHSLNLSGWEQDFNIELSQGDMLNADLKTGTGDTTDTWGRINIRLGNKIGQKACDIQIYPDHPSQGNSSGYSLHNFIVKYTDGSSYNLEIGLNFNYK